MKKNYKHFFYDMDGTLTRTRTEILESMANLIRKLTAKGADVIIVSGAEQSRIYKQLGSVAEECYILSQNGNVAFDASGAMMWEHELNWVQQSEIFNFVDVLQRVHSMDNNKFDLVENRGSQISYSFTGHHAPIEVKEAFDKDREFRKKVLNDNAKVIKKLLEMDVHCAIGGTTCLDFYTKDKGQNIAQLIKDKKWKKSECVYTGDALHDGGNDETVRGVIEIQAVKDHIECESVVKEHIDGFVVEVIEVDEDVDESDGLGAFSEM